MSLELFLYCKREKATQTYENLNNLFSLNSDFAGYEYMYTFLLIWIKTDCKQTSEIPPKKAFISLYREEISFIFLSSCHFYLWHKDILCILLVIHLLKLDWLSSHDVNSVVFLCQTFCRFTKCDWYLQGNHIIYLYINICSISYMHSMDWQNDNLQYWHHHDLINTIPDAKFIM